MAEKTITTKKKVEKNIKKVNIRKVNTKKRNVKTAGPIDRYVGKKIKFKRIQVGMSQKELGGHLGVAFQQLQKYESGLNRTPVERLFKMTKIFNIPINYFFDGAEDLV